MTIELTPEQAKAISEIKTWFKNRYTTFPPRPFKLAGLAGTGKSTLVPYIIDDLGLDDSQVRYCAYTGKAALVLRKKGLPATTIHKLIYKPVELPDGKVIFVKNFQMDFGVKLILVDESSMVDKKLQEDLESYGIPVLYIGDHGQLPPVSSDIANIMLHPDYRLETIHRQAMDNPIIWIAHQARQGMKIKVGSYGNKVQKLTHKNFRDEHMWKASQILCGKNATRNVINQKFRVQAGFHTSPYPLPEDKLICLKNSSANGLINGMIGACINYDIDTHMLSFESDEDLYYNLPVVDCIFLGSKPEKYIKEVEQFDFGYAITVHKSQGSQFEKVLLIEEQLAGGSDNHRRWLYTGITRAIDKLIIVSE